MPATDPANLAQHLGGVSTVVANPQLDSEAIERRKLIRQIGDLRQSYVVTYVLSDRQGAVAQIADDAVRPLYDHLRTAGQATRFDLFIYSTGGFTDVPWRIVSMIREFTESFGVLVPYRAMSAATMIALGADEIAMGPKGELGPIDPQIGIQRGREGETPAQEQFAVEDIMSYLRLLKERVGLSDQAALASSVAILAEKLDPWILGQAYRAHSHIRDVARKLLATRLPSAALDEQKASAIIETLAEKTYQHGHAIGRREAELLGLNVIRPEPELESKMWRLLELYERLCQTREPIDAEAALAGKDEVVVPVVLGAIESAAQSHQIAGELRLTRQRQMPANLNMNLQLGLNLPPGFDAAKLPQDLQAALQQLLASVQKGLPELVQAEVRRQAPPTGFQGRLQTSGWRSVDGWNSGHDDEELEASPHGQRD